MSIVAMRKTICDNKRNKHKQKNKTRQAFPSSLSAHRPHPGSSKTARTKAALVRSRSRDRASRRTLDRSRDRASLVPGLHAQRLQPRRRRRRRRTRKGRKKRRRRSRRRTRSLCMEGKRASEGHLPTLLIARRRRPMPHVKEFAISFANSLSCL